MASQLFKSVRELNPAFTIFNKGGDIFARYQADGAKPVAPAGYCWQQNRRIYGWTLAKYTTQASIERRLKLLAEPWREYCDWGPNDMPPKKGNPRALAALMAECGELVTD